MNINQSSGTAILSTKSTTSPSGSIQLSSHKYSSPHEALETSILVTLAANIRSCGHLFDRVALRVGRGGGKGAVEKFVDNCFCALTSPLEELAGFCRSRGIENPLLLLVILNTAENFAVVFEGQHGAYERLLRQSGGEIPRDHYYASLASSLIGDDKSFSHGEGIKAGYPYLARHLKSITDIVMKMCKGNNDFLNILIVVVDLLFCCCHCFYLSFLLM